MRTFEIFTIWAMVLLMSRKLLVTALPVFDYIWRDVVRTERLHSDDCDPTESLCIWPGGLFGFGMGQSDSGLPAVNAPAVVYPHDTAPTATAPDDSTNLPTEASIQCTLTPAPDLKLQRRDPIANPEKLSPVIPSDIQVQETTAPQTEPLPAMVECGGISSCPTGYKRFIIAMRCWCRLDGGSR